mgnify:FL=1
MTIERSWRSIRPARYRSHLLALDLPYTVFQQQPYRLDASLKSYEFSSRNTKQVMTIDRQREHYDKCMSQIKSANPGSKGWTLSLSGEVHLGVLEAAAAHMAGTALHAGVEVLWIDISKAMQANAYEIWNMPSMKISPRTPRLVVLTALTSTMPDVRWSRATDLLRSTTSSMWRIVVCSGHIPPDTGRRLHMPINYPLNIGKPQIYL